MAVVFFSYSHKDEQFRDRLEVHLTMLKRQGLIEAWHDRRIIAGDEFHNVISEQLERAQVILLLVSPDFLASDYCYDIELSRAMERHDAREARVIPVILRPCDWHSTPFGKLTAVPRDGMPISTWPDLDEAYLEVVKAIKAAVQTAARPVATPSNRSGQRQSSTAAGHDWLSHPRSSNLAIKKHFTDVDKDRHLDQAFDFVSKFFEGSLHELQQRNTGLQTTFRAIDADCFTAIVYRDGKTVSECKIKRGGFMGNGISYSSNARRHENSVNECLSVEADDQGMFLRPLMNMGGPSSRDDAKLSFEGAAEYYWAMLIGRLR